MTISDRGLDLIAEFEGCRLTAYRDIVGVLTIGYGHTGTDVYAGQTITSEQAMLLLRQDAQKSADCVNDHGPQMNQNQFDALVSFAFNLGCESLKTMLAHGWDQVPNQILRWDRAGGVIVPGLVARRQAERDLFLTPVTLSA